VDADGRCLGVLSTHDFVNRDGAEGEEVSFITPGGDVIKIDDAPGNEIRNYMTRQPVTVAPTTPLGELAQKMVDAHIHRVLVVTEEDRPRGIVTSTDILAAVGLAARKASLEEERPHTRGGRARRRS
jgi:CBS domain-containing protein